MNPIDEPAEVFFEDRPAGYMVLRECDNGEWAWAWQRPDGFCQMGTDDDAETAADHVAQAVKRFYDAAH